MDAELILTVVLKLFGIYLLFLAASQSGYLLDSLMTIASAGRVSMDVMQWGGALSAFAALGVSAGLAIVLIRHGDRAAHWLSVRSGVRAPIATPSAQWYRGAVAIIGVWLLVTRGPGAIYSVVLFAASRFDPSPSGEIFGSWANGVLVHVNLILTLAIGLILVFSAQRIGDGLNRICAAAIAEPADTIEH